MLGHDPATDRQVNRCAQRIGHPQAGSAPNKPMCADYLDDVVWDHLTGLLADPGLIRAEIDKRLEGARHSDPPSASGNGWRPR